MNQNAFELSRSKSTVPVCQRNVMLGNVCDKLIPKLRQAKYYKGNICYSDGIKISQETQLETQGIHLVKSLSNILFSLFSKVQKNM